MEHLLCAMHMKCPRHFTDVNKFKPHSNAVRWVLPSSSLYRQRHYAQKKPGSGHPARKWRSFWIHSPDHFRCCLYTNIIHIIVNFLKLGVPTAGTFHLCEDSYFTKCSYTSHLICPVPTYSSDWCLHYQTGKLRLSDLPLFRLLRSRAVTQTQVSWFRIEHSF